jgi:heme/copper-type cytochrome/quinol oxidase subunit 2
MHLILDSRSNSSGNRIKPRYPNLWVIIGVVASIIIVLVILVITIIYIRSRRKNNKNQDSPEPIPAPRRLFY